MGFFLPGSARCQVVIMLSCSGELPSRRSQIRQYIPDGGRQTLSAHAIIYPWDSLSQTVCHVTQVGTYIGC